MKHNHRLHGILAGAGLALLLVGLAVIWSLYLPAASARAAQLPPQKPVSGWYVCRDLGIGTVPGVPGVRQRLRLCHAEGWAVNTYCTQPGLPVPPVGRRCTRISDDTYRCGAGNQRLREYRTLATPVATSTPTATPTQTSTPPAGVATETRAPRTPTGGEGNAAQVRTLVYTEISIFSLALCLGIWFLWRLVKRG